MFDRYIGIDYSGAGDPRGYNKGLAVAVAERVSEGLDDRGRMENAGDPMLVGAYANATSRANLGFLAHSAASAHSGVGLVRQRWSRELVYQYIRDQLLTGERRVIIGIDHGFSYPASRLRELGLDSWDDFLYWFRGRWKTQRYTVEQAKRLLPYASTTDKRLAEREFTPNAKSVLDLDRRESLQGAVSYSTHAGLAWIARLRRLQRRRQLRVHFWPFDGVDVPDGWHVIAEAYPSLYRKRVELEATLNEHERDAASIAAWLRNRDYDGTLRPYLALPTLTPAELELSRLEGWILGCL